jgi:hypothetical protein
MPQLRSGATAGLPSSAPSADTLLSAAPFTPLFHNYRESPPLEQNMSKPHLAAAFAILAITSLANRSVAEEQAAANKDLLKGHALTINVTSESAPSTDINVSGLLIIEIPDSGSRPPQNMSVKTSRTFEQLGRLRGINTDRKSGRPLMGGGYTWFLFTPKNESKTEEVEVKWTPNGGGAPMTKKYKLKVPTAE